MKKDLATFIGSLVQNVETPVAVSGTTAYPSNVMDVRDINNCSVIGIPVGTFTGSLQLQVSHDKINWINLGSSQAVTGGTPFRIPQVDLPDCYLQGIYTNATGSGTLYCSYNGKGV